MLRVRNTLSRSVEPIEPLEPGRVSIYSCGPTVYRPIHVGNLRTFLLADLLRRVLDYHGLRVKSVMNITDVGHMTDELTDSGRDRMELAAADEGLAPDEIAAKYTEKFLADCDALGIERFDYYPKASEHVEAMIDIAAGLIERGHAYERDGNVYYDVESFPAYGALSGQSLGEMQAGHRVEVDAAKRRPQDFLLWKAAGPGRLVSFDSPWGRGYPGWHIECSAMSMALLGPRFDVHTGGVDNVFPHHEDEIAQSEGVTGERVVSTWVHGEHLLLSEAKMAKSAGNVVTLGDLPVEPAAFRYLCLTARYRRQVHFSPEALDGAATALRRLRERIATLATGTGGGREPADDKWENAFVTAIDDDLDFPAALVVLHEMLGDEAVSPDVRRSMALSWDRVLGLGLAGSDHDDPDVGRLVAERDAARADKDWAKADAVRAELAARGVDVIDTPSGTKWVRRP